MRSHASVAACTVALVVACVTATKPAVQSSKACSKIECLKGNEYWDANCEDYQVWRKIFQAGATGAPGGKYGQCCDTFKCVQDPANPCGGKVCAADTLEEATDNCNNLFPEDPIWTSLQPNAGAMYAVLKRPALNKAGRCCDEYTCRTNHTLLCENLVEKTPCADAATCPLGHYAEVVRAANPEEKRCCDEIRCVADPVQLCALRDDSRVCPTPACDATANGFNLQTVVTLFQADPYSGRCCPTRSCQNDLVAICNAERTRVGYDRDNLCGTCEIPFIIEEEDLATGKCFPQWKCLPKPNHLCCGFDNNTCSDPPAGLGDCQSVATNPADEFFGPCCDQYRIVTNSTCVCDADIAANGCPYNGDPNEFQMDVCDAQMPGMYEVSVTSPNPDIGRCCPGFSCKKTAAALLRDMNKKKKKKKYP